MVFQSLCCDFFSQKPQRIASLFIVGKWTVHRALGGISSIFVDKSIIEEMNLEFAMRLMTKMINLSKIIERYYP